MASWTTRATYCCLLLLASCAPSRKEAREWLESLRGASDTDLSGRWDAGPSLGGGWGEGIFIQNEDIIQGTLGAYGVTGVVRGAELFLVLVYSGSVYYTAQLSLRPDGSLLGLAAEGALYDPERKAHFRTHPISLHRVVH
jgi:hypothetical protein